MTRKVLLALAASVLVAGALVAAIAAAAGPQQVRLGGAPRRPAGSSVVGSLSKATPMRVTVALEPRDPAALRAYATEVATPGSSVYRHYLTLAQFRQRFGPTSAQIDSVLASLRAHGLTPGAVTANGLAIPVSSTAGAIARAFSTSFQQVRVRGGRKAFANTHGPLLDSSVAGLVQGVIGLNSLVVPHPLALRATAGRAKTRVSRQVVTGGPQPCSTATSAAPGQSAYTTDQIASAYDFSGLYGAGDEGAGETVAIFELENNFKSDITAFKSCYGITTGTVSYTKVDGGPGAPSAANEDGIETELDMENVIGLAPGANVHMYQGPYFTEATDADVYDTYNAMVTSGAQVLSTSWGECEQDDTSGPEAESTLFEETATQGQSVFAAAGDSGSEDCGDDSLGVDDPASQPDVTGAGGTSLTTLGPPPSESVWNDECEDGPCGGGGGVSTLWQMPSYQSGAPAGLNVINSNSSGAPCGAPSGTYCREVPDVSADADPNTGYLIYWDGNGNATDSDGWIGIGGTSGAAPLWAGLAADADASAACNGTPVGFANPALYDAAAVDYSSDFNDVTVGNNDITGTNNGLYPAGPGYDMASGLGTPNADHAAAAMCGDLVTITNPGSQTSTVSQGDPSVQVQIDAADSGTNTLTYSATGLPSGVSIDPTTGLISGEPTVGGTYSVTASATDADGGAGQVTFSWTITTPVTVTNPGAQSTVEGMAVNLQLSGSSGNSYTDNNTLPPGLSIDPASGLISGNPTTVGTYQVMITATATPYSDSEQFTWTITPVDVNVTAPGNQVGIVGIATSLQAHASDNNDGSLSYSATGLPTGLSIDPTTGLISGTPTATGTYGTTLTATDGATSSSSGFTWTISSATVAVANPGNQTGTVGTPAQLQINAADNNGGALFYGATGLPPGLSVNDSTGVISGTPTTAGSFSVTIGAVDGGSSASTRFSWTVSGPPNSSGGSLAGIAAGKPKFSLTLSAGTEAPAIKKIVLTLPKGLSFNRKLGKGLKLTEPNGTQLSGFKKKAAGRRLTITLAQPVAQVRVAIGPLAIAAGEGLIAKVKHGTAGKLTVKLTITDASGRATAIALKLSPS